MVKGLPDPSAVHDLSRLTSGAVGSSLPDVAEQLGAPLRCGDQATCLPEPNGVPCLTEVVNAIAGHHERWDGQGYPRGLAGKSIGLLARILAIADAYAAMTADRPFKPALAHDEALAEVRRAAGSQLDPELVETFLDMHGHRDRPIVEIERVLSASSAVATA